MVKPARTYPTAVSNTFTRNSPRRSLCLTTGHRETIRVAKLLYSLYAVEVWEKINICAVAFAIGKDTRNGSADIGLCEASNGKIEEGL